MDCVSQFKIEVPSCEEISNKTIDGKVQESSNQMAVVEGLTLYPNPAKEVVNLKYNFAASNLAVEIYDIAGRNISRNVLSSSSGELQITTATYEAGMYMVVIKDGDTILAQKKLLIE